MSKTVEKRGKRSKKILHALHVLWEFLRKIWTTFGESPKTAKKISHKTASETKDVGQLTGKGTSSVGKHTMVKSGALKSSGWNSLGTGKSFSISATTLETTNTGTTLGTVISAKTLAVVLLAGGIFLGGLGIYSYLNQQNPVSAMENILNPNNQGPNSGENNLNPDKMAPNILINSLILAIGTGSISQTSTGNYPATDTGDTSQSGSGSSPFNNDDSDDSGTDTPTINYTIP